MTETPGKITAYFALAGTWATMSGLSGLVWQRGFATVLAIGKITVGILFLVAARQVNQSLLHSPRKLLRPLWGTGALIIGWFLAQQFGDSSKAGSTLAGNVFALMCLVVVLLIVWYLRKNVLRLSALALNAPAVAQANSSVSAQSVWHKDKAWDALAGFAVLSGLLPGMLLSYLVKFKLFGQALALSFYTGLNFLFLLAIVLIIVSTALWVTAAGAVWFRKRPGLLFLTILCGLRSTFGVLCLFGSLKVGLVSPKYESVLSARAGQNIVLTLVLVTTIYAIAAIFSWRCYRSACVW